MRIDINADIGEGFGQWQFTDDAHCAHYDVPGERTDMPMSGRSRFSHNVSPCCE